MLAAGFFEHWNLRRNLAFVQPAQQWPGAADDFGTIYARGIRLFLWVEFGLSAFAPIKLASLAMR